MMTTTQREHKPGDKTASAAALLDAALSRHPVLTLTAVLALTGCGMVLAVTLFAALWVLPLGLLFGLY